MLVLNVDETKRLSVRQDNNIYVGEYNADIIKILLYKEFNATDIENCIVTLTFLNDDDKIVDIVEANDLTVYDNSYYLFYYHIPGKLTMKEGNIRCWVEITDLNNSMLVKTNIIELKISPHINTDEKISDTEWTIISSWQTKMNQTLDKCQTIADSLQSYTDGLKEQIDEINNYLNNLKTGAVFITSTNEEGD